MGLGGEWERGAGGLSGWGRRGDNALGSWEVLVKPRLWGNEGVKRFGQQPTAPRGQSRRRRL